MSAATKPKLGFWMNLPDGWIPLDPSSERVPDQVARILDSRADTDPHLSAHRGNVERQLTAALKAARTRDLVFGAILATFTRDGFPIAASLAVTRHTAPTAAEAGAILEGLGTDGAKANTLLDTPFAGTVVRSAYRERVAASDAPHAESTEVAVFQYFLPTPDRRRVLVATGATPTLPMADVFGTLFDAMVSTFQFVNETDGDG